MNNSEIKNKLVQFQNTLSLLQREEKNLLEELKTLGINSIEEAKVFLERLTTEDVSKLEKEVTELEAELQKWLQQ